MKEKQETTVPPLQLKGSTFFAIQKAEDKERMMASSYSSSSHVSLSTQPPPLLRPSSSSSFSVSFSSFPTRKPLPCRCSYNDQEAPVSAAPATVTASASPCVDPKKGVSIYKPKSYQVLVGDAATSLAFALQDGITRLDIDFP